VSYSIKEIFYMLQGESLPASLQCSADSPGATGGTGLGKTATVQHAASAAQISWVQMDRWAASTLRPSWQRW